MAEEVESIVIGAGVVGLAVARALAHTGKEVLVLESADEVGTGVTARSSEVIHAGLYYSEGSQKAKFCVLGRQLLYQFCRDHHVPFSEIGKLVVATNPNELYKLHELCTRGYANGVTGIETLSEADVRTKEPLLRAAGALYLPMTGIVDTRALITALRADLEAANATIALRAPFQSARSTPDFFQVEAGNGNNSLTLHSRILVNTAGLSAQSVASRIKGLQENMIPERHLSRGNYFSLSTPAPFKHLVYPLPDKVGLGIHYCLDMAGQARFGPDHEWVNKIDYTVDPCQTEKFADAIRKYWPDLPKDALKPAYAGIRPRISGPGQPTADFHIQTHDQHMVAGLVNLFGIESPGLTAALAIADYVAKYLE